MQSLWTLNKKKTREGAPEVLLSASVPVCRIKMGCCGSRSPEGGRPCPTGTGSMVTMEQLRFVKPVSTLQEDLYVIRTSTGRLYARSYKNEQMPPVQEGVFVVRTCSISGVCGYSPKPPEQRIVFQGASKPQQASVGKPYEMQPRFIGNTISRRDGTWEWDVGMIETPPFGPEQALCTPGLYFIREGPITGYQLRCLAYNETVLCVSKTKAKGGADYPLMILPLDQAKQQLAYTFVDTQAP
ncbi:uncharacterized protein LOC135830553 [Sycon ciliatum]|uniref:uncharacterized protein LOC135830553 n=1 Tax=Sycon ciliatum TaxID=27933 RepID=UPI0031F634F0|eukprot:scpid93825/ scgid33770/ 